MLKAKHGKPECTEVLRPFAPLSWVLRMSNEKEKAWGGTSLLLEGIKRRGRALPQRTISGVAVPMGPQGTGKNHCLSQKEKEKHRHPWGWGRKYLLLIISGGDWLP